MREKGNSGGNRGKSRSLYVAIYFFTPKFLTKNQYPIPIGVLLRGHMANGGRWAYFRPKKRAGGECHHWDFKRRIETISDV